MTLLLGKDYVSIRMSFLISEVLVFYQGSFVKTILYLRFTQNPKQARKTAMRVGDLKWKLKLTKDRK